MATQRELERAENRLARTQALVAVGITEGGPVPPTIGHVHPCSGSGCASARSPGATAAIEAGVDLGATHEAGEPLTRPRRALWERALAERTTPGQLSLLGLPWRIRTSPCAAPRSSYTASEGRTNLVRLAHFPRMQPKSW